MHGKRFFKNICMNLQATKGLFGLKPAILLAWVRGEWEGVPKRDLGDRILVQVTAAGIALLDPPPNSHSLPTPCPRFWLSEVDAAQGPWEQGSGGDAPWPGLAVLCFMGCCWGFCNIGTAGRPLILSFLLICLEYLYHVWGRVINFFWINWWRIESLLNLKRAFTSFFHFSANLSIFMVLNVCVQYPHDCLSVCPIIPAFNMYAAGHICHIYSRTFQTLHGVYISVSVSPYMVSKDCLCVHFKSQ